MTQEEFDRGPIAAFLDVNPADANAVHRIVWGLAGIVGAAFTVPGAMVAAEQELAKQTSLRAIPSTLLDPSSALEAERRGLLTDASVAETLARQGYGPEAVRVLHRLAQQLLGPVEVVDLWRRGELTEEERDARLERVGWVGDEAAGIVALSDFKPPVQDVIGFAVREVFRPEVRARFELDAEFPGDDPETGADLMALFEAVGISEENARRYWAAHWTLPSLQQAFEMLHRTEDTGVTGDDIDSLLLAADVMRRWREPLKAIAFSPITRVDVRRWHAVGLLTVDELEERYRHVGFSPADAVQMAEFTVRFNERSEDDALEPFRGPLRTRAISLWRRGALSAEALRAVFTDLGYPADQADTFMTAAEFEREADHTEAIIAQVKPLYVRGFWTETEAIQRLSGLGFGMDELRTLLDEWTLARELREETASDRAERDLSKSDVLGAFRSDIIQEVDARAFLLTLGYDDDETQLLITREEQRKTSESRSRAEAGARALFLAGRNDRAHTVSLLAQSEITSGRIELLLLQWESERDARLPELTVAQVQKAFRSGILERDAAARRLDTKGYTSEDRDILLTLAGEAEGVTEEGV